MFLATTKITRELANKVVRKYLAVQPNHEVVGGPNPMNNKNPSKCGYKILGKHTVYFDQCPGAEHPFLYKIEIKFIKTSTIILIRLMTVAYHHEQQICFVFKGKILERDILGPY